ncbi:hypothetical protein JI664_21570 [Rhodobacter sp. NTK016B]|uniref:hypothetical protein n=1 Tax=Rhodobacter sp. NTK016B TaxID=2759676 RepID=UPI001A8F3B49|nr:hypothetical protein [Rhodobacter sp. NTK016B]MBN8294577.1 hypothetical protein [Rhodobacter sp. NTK016B]
MGVMGESYNENVPAAVERLIATEGAPVHPVGAAVVAGRGMPNAGATGHVISYLEQPFYLFERPNLADLLREFGNAEFFDCRVVWATGQITLANSGRLLPMASPIRAVE